MHLNNSEEKDASFFSYLVSTYSQSNFFTRKKLLFTIGQPCSVLNSNGDSKHFIRAVSADLSFGILLSINNVHCTLHIVN